MSRSSSSQLLAQASSGATTCPMAPAPASWLRLAPGSPRDLWLQLPPTGSGQLRRRRVSRGSGSRLLAWGNSGATTCPKELYGL
jgi:hypothetical protein